MSLAGGLEEGLLRQADGSVDDNEEAASSSATSWPRRPWIGGRFDNAPDDSRELPHGSVTGVTSSCIQAEEDDADVENRRENGCEDEVASSLLATTDNKDLAGSGGGTDHNFEAFKRDLTAIVSELSCSPSRPGSRATVTTTAQRGARRSAPRIGRQPPVQSSLLLSASLLGPDAGGNRRGAGSRRAAAERRRIGWPSRQCAGPCCAPPSGQHRTAPPRPVRSPRERPTAGGGTSNSINEPATSGEGLLPSNQRCYVVNDPTFNAATLVSSTE
jgi:hypothetical protein